MSSSQSSRDYETLKDLLCRKSVRLGEFILASGEKSNVYVDSKLTTYSAEAMPLVGKLFLEKLKQSGWHPDAIGGLTLGADPIAFAIARESLHTAQKLPAFVVRKQEKSHGMGRLIAGLENTSGVSVVIIDDVCTKGGSTAQAIETAQSAGMKVLGAVCLVDRNQGATELLTEKFGVKLESIFRLSELVEHLRQASQPVEARR
jgi:orotate phosphoribosyltransferase